MWFDAADNTFGGRESIIDPSTGELYIRSKEALDASNNIWYKYNDLLSISTALAGYVFDNDDYHANIETQYANKTLKFLAPGTPRYALAGYDTGGYTGEWGNEGRLAMLHQKEIILNATDTENFLQAINIVREISKSIDLNAQSASGGLQGIYAAHIPNNN